VRHQLMGLVWRSERSGWLPAIVVMQAAKDGMGDNLAAVWERLRRARDGLRDALVGSGQVEVADVLLDDVVKVALTEDQVEVEALASEAAEEAFADGIGRQSGLHLNGTVRSKHSK